MYPCILVNPWSKQRTGGVSQACETSSDVVLQLAPKCNTSVAFLADIRFLFILLIGYSGIFSN